MSSSFGSRVFLVTGGSRGIGKEIVRQLLLSGQLARDDKVLLAARNPSDGDKAKEEFFSQGIDVEGYLHTVKLDLLNEQSAVDLSERIGKEFGGVDVLINNAGYAIKGEGFDADIASTTLGVNFFGTVRFTDSLLPLMRQNSRIINISSSMGVIGSRYKEPLKSEITDRDNRLTKERILEIMSGFINHVREGTYDSAGFPRSTYMVSKCGLNMWTKWLVRGDPIVREKGIFVAAVDPGWVKSDMGGPSAPRNLQKGAETPVWLSLLSRSALSHTGLFWKDMENIGW